MLKKAYIFLAFWLTAFSCKISAQGLDLRVLESINPRYPTSQYWKYTSLSAYVFAGAVTVVPYAYGLASNDEAAKYRSYNILIGMGINIAIMEGLKLSVNRTRPAIKHPDLVFQNSQANGQSFPSGHTSLAFNTAAELSIIYKKWYITVPAYAWATSVGYSRMYLGKHYPSDVLGGAILGVGSAYASDWLNRKWFKSYYQKK